MGNMISKFLNAKHWQLFLLIVGLPLITQIILVVAMMTNIANADNPDPSLIFTYMQILPLLMIVFMGLQFGWFWSMAIGLQSKVPENVKMKVKKFKIFFFIPLIYLVALSILMSIFFYGFSVEGTELDLRLIPFLMLFIMPLHLFSMFCILYSIYFVAKTFKTVELQRAVNFSDFVGEFFMVWFYPIGIWFIQPKVNVIVEK